MIMVEGELSWVKYLEKTRATGMEPNLRVRQSLFGREDALVHMRR